LDPLLIQLFLETFANNALQTVRLLEKINFGIIIRYEYSSMTQKGAARSSEITVLMYQTTRRHTL
jgi:hypothetical protein